MNDLKIYCEDEAYAEKFSALAKAFEGEFESDCTLSCEVVIIAAEEIRRLNNDTRGVDAVTDVLSFPSLDGILNKKLEKAAFPADTDEEGNLFIGSIAICESRAKEQAEEYGHSLYREMSYLAAHGVCHLLGYDHMTDEDQKLMREKEEKVLAKINAVRE
ncbi:MAG: rRNA maturation RNase YbeY [Clostridia bacterium]|nr:rRNA maturation RNase YbeY [Clostridia bacterium]